MAFVATTTLSAGFLSVRDNYWPMAVGPNDALRVQGYVNSFCMVAMMVMVVIMIVPASDSTTGTY